MIRPTLAILSEVKSKIYQTMNNMFASCIHKQQEPGSSGHVSVTV